jgi:hypothetical protein
MSDTEATAMAEQTKKKVSDFFDDINAAEKARAILKQFFVKDLLGPSLSLGEFFSTILNLTIRAEKFGPGDSCELLGKPKLMKIP